MQLFIKILSGMANSVNLIRLLLKEQSDLTLHCLYMPFYHSFGVLNSMTFTILDDIKALFSVCSTNLPIYTLPNYPMIYQKLCLIISKYFRYHNVIS